MKRSASYPEHVSAPPPIRRALEDAVHIPEEVRRVQEELDNARFAEDFEAAVAAMDRGLDDPVFSDRVALYQWGELEYKSGTRLAILPNPSHRCSRDQGCRMTRLEVNVYRRTVPVLSGDTVPAAGGAAPLSGSFAARALKDGGQARMYHLCIASTCEHLIPGHICHMKPQCWHLHGDRRDDTMPLEDFWVCNQTGNLHVCGHDCMQAKDITDGERDLVCTLTGQVISGRRPVTEFEAAAEQRDPRALSLTGKSDGGPAEDTEAARVRRQQAVARGARRSRAAAASRVPSWGPSNEEHEYRLFARRMVTDLLFSKKRQMLEATTYIAAYKRALAEVNKFMRVRRSLDGIPADNMDCIRTTLMTQDYLIKKCGVVIPEDKRLRFDERCPPLVMAAQAPCVYLARRPVSEYFANVPMMDDVKQYVSRCMVEAETEHLETDRRQPSDINMLQQYQFHQQDHEDAAKKARRDYEQFLDKVIRGYRERHGIVRPEPTRWDSERWQSRMENIIQVFAHTLVRVWRNLMQHVPPGPGRQTLAFGRIALGLLYLTKTSLSVQDMQITSCASFVTVVPLVEFARLLPWDNQLSMFDLDEYAQAGARRLTKTQGDVRDEAIRVSKMGALPSLLLRIEDIMAELVEEQRRQREAASTAPVQIPVGK